MHGSSWAAQLREAVAIGDDDRSSPVAWLLHALMLPWKILFALVGPPADMCGGLALFIGSLLGIMLQVVLIGDLASQLGCELGMRDSVTAITIVALGTSLPDLFASMTAAKDDDTADNSIGNVTGSNSVNVFLGLGLPWMVASIYWASVGATPAWQAAYPTFYQMYGDRGGFVVCAGSLAFSVTVFAVVATITLGLIVLRRVCLNPSAELGGSRNLARATFAGFAMLYGVYLTFSIMRSEDVGGFSGFLSSYTSHPDCQ
jgi:solute carrier family 8 (sodium/calcium exchanger)